MPQAPKAAIVPSDTIEIDNTVIRCQKSRSLIDANDIFNMITNTASSAERLVWSKFKLTDPGVYRVKWDTACGGLGRISVRADLMSQQLRQIKHGKCETALQIAEKLDAEFPNAGLTSRSQMEQTGPVEEVDTSNGTLMLSTQIVPSNQMIRSTVCKEIAQLACSHVSTDEMQNYGKAMLQSQKSVLKHQEDEAKGLISDKRVTDKIYHKMIRAREIGDVELERELKRRFLDA